MTKNDFKMLFLNVQTLTTQKILFLLTLLGEFNIIFLSEVNHKQQLLADIPLHLCQTHFDQDTPRLAMICTHSTKFEYKGPSLNLKAIRVQVDQTVAQSNLYRINFQNNRCFEVENTYIVPDILSNDLNLVKQHFIRQSNKSVSYVAGGDFNLNWFTSKKSKFKIPLLTQNVSAPTRIQHMIRNGRDRTTKTLIDLIFTTDKMNLNVTDCSILKPLPSGFDHFGVTLSTNFRVKHKFRDVPVPYDPFRRPEPTDEQRTLISKEIDDLVHTCPNDYDMYFLMLKRIFDKYIPENRKEGFYNKRYFDVPYNREIRDEIKLKDKLRRQYRMNPSEINLAARNKQRNLVTNLTRNFKKDYQSNLLTHSADLNSVKHVYKTLEILQISPNHHKEPQRIVIDGKTGTDLANHLSEYFRSRAEDLVPTSLIEASQDLSNVIQPYEIPENTLEISGFPQIQKIEKVIPPKKTTKTASMDTISSHTFVSFWENIKTKFNDIISVGGLFFPQINQGYYQRTISKSDKKQPEILKDMRPLGILNPIPKYHFAKHVFTLIRDHMIQICINRGVYTYHGVRLPIITTLDKAIIIALMYFTAIVKYDFSNAFGTIYPPRLDSILEQLNLGDSIRKFVSDYFNNQSYCQTVFNDPISGIHTSELTKMNKGSVQGQIGSDVCFTIQQFGLSPSPDIERDTYMDDFNDNLLNCKSPRQAVNLSITNDMRLNSQAITVGFAKNEGKTTFIPVNIQKSEFTDQGIDEDQVVSKSGILGFNFEFIDGKLNVTQAANDIISSLKQHLRTIHSTRTYLDNHLTRLKIARTCIYYHLMYLPLIYAYGEKPSGLNKSFERIQVAVNDLIRATGLVPSTPKRILNRCLGTKLVDFVKQQIICDGLKQLKFTNENPFDRCNQIRLSGNFRVAGTFMFKFRTVWNELDAETRKQFLEIPIDSVKAILKKRRILEYDRSIYDEYKWRDLNLEN